MPDEDTPRVMEEEVQEPSKKRLTKILVGIVAIIVVISVLGVTLLAGWADELITPPGSEPTEPEEPTLTQTFESLNASQAYHLMNITANFTPVDIRNCKCNYNNGHLPNAIWEPDAPLMYNFSADVLVYDQDGRSSVEYCEKLVNHTYHKIYRLTGGINAWQLAGFPTPRPS